MAGGRESGLHQRRSIRRSGWEVEGCKRVFQVEELLLETKFTGLSQRGHEAGDKVAKGEGAEMTRAR